MALWDVTKNTEIMNYLEQKALEAVPTWNVFRTPTYFASPQDFAAVAGDTYTKPYKCIYAIFEFANFQNSLTKGCEHDPNVLLTYQVQLYRSYQEAIDSGSNSHDLLLGDLIAFRNTILGGLTINPNSVEIIRIDQLGDMQKAINCPYIVNDIGDLVNLRITVEVNNG